MGKTSVKMDKKDCIQLVTVYRQKMVSAEAPVDRSVCDEKADSAT